MKIIKKNQIIIYTLALMLITAGYLNFTNNASITTNASTMETKKTSSNANEISNVNSLNDINDTNNDAIEIENTEKRLVENAEGKLVEVTNAKNENEIQKENDTKINKKEENEKVADIGDATLVSSNDVVEDYFAKSKLDRDNMYSQMLESYEKILNNANSTDTQKQSITEEIKKINNTKNSIMICENLIRTKGFDNSVVFINGDSVSVVVGAKELKTEEIAQIQNIITRELNVDIENIHISVR